MATTSTRCLRDAGQEWLLSCTPHRADTQRAWDDDTFAEIPTGPYWRVAEAPLTRSVQAIQRIGADRIGPVLADVYRDVAWWLLPPDLADDLDDIPRITVRPAGWVLKSPPVERSLEGRWWLEWPDGTGRLTDPVLLGAAFGPGGRLSEAAR